MFIFAIPSTYGSLPPPCTTRSPSPKYPSLYVPSYNSGGGSKEGVRLEDRYVSISEIPNIGSKVPGYEGGRLPMRNINGGRNAMKVSYICDLSRLQKVRHERETTTEIYIHLFI